MNNNGINERFKKYINAVLLIAGGCTLAITYSFTHINNSESERSESLHIDDKGLTISSNPQIRESKTDNN